MWPNQIAPTTLGSRPSDTGERADLSFQPRYEEGEKTVMIDGKLATKNGNRKVLIIYYSYSGNTRKVAHEIYKVVGGAMVEIEPVVPYPGTYNSLVEQAKRELHTGYRPELKTSIGNVSSYDTVFVGSPNWLNTIAPPVISLLSETDLAGKTIIPFITHGGGGAGRSIQDIAGLCPHATVLKGLAVYGADVNAAQKWLAANWPIQQ